MFRMVAAFVFVLLLALGAAWLADQPGELVVRFGETEVVASLLIGGLGLLMFALVVIVVWRSYHAIVEAPGRIGDYVRARGRRRGLEALSRGMIAAGAGDAAGAAREAALAERQLGEMPLTLLLRAQTAQLKGDETAARRAFEAMLDEPETEILGLRGLFMLARKAGDADAARALAERAMRRSPQVPWASLALFELQSASTDFAGALSTLDNRRRHKLVERKEADRLAAVLRTAQAQELAESEPDAALEHALEAHRLAPELVPAAVIAGRILAEKAEPGRAAKIIERTWRASPHPDLAVVYAYLRPGDSPRDRLKRVRSLAAKRPDSIEGPIAVAHAALEARAFDEARGALEPHLGGQPSQRVCALVAEIEAGEHGDRGRVREWLARAVNAPRDPAWTADGTVSPIWRPLSPVTGALDAFEWRVPVTGVVVAAGRGLETMQDDEPADGTALAALPHRADESEADEKTRPAAPEIIAKGKTGEPAEGTDRAVGGPRQDRRARLDAVTPPAATADAASGNSDQAEVLPPPIPDDPGVASGEDEDESAALGITLSDRT